MPRFYLYGLVWKWISTKAACLGCFACVSQAEIQKAQRRGIEKLDIARGPLMLREPSYTTYVLFYLLKECDKGVSQADIRKEGNCLLYFLNIASPSFREQKKPKDHSGDSYTYLLSAVWNWIHDGHRFE